MRIQVAQAVFSGITAAVAVGGVAFTIVSLRRSRRERKREFLATYLKEFRDVEFGKAIARLWDLYRACGYDKEEMNREYKRMADENGLHFHLAIRRKVTAFYQELGFLADRDKDIMKWVSEVWGLGDVYLIKHILLPIERGEAIRHLGGIYLTPPGIRAKISDAWTIFPTVLPSSNNSFQLKKVAAPTYQN